MCLPCDLQQPIEGAFHHRFHGVDLVGDSAGLDHGDRLMDQREWIGCEREHLDSNLDCAVGIQRHARPPADQVPGSSKLPASSSWGVWTTSNAPEAKSTRGADWATRLLTPRAGPTARVSAARGKARPCVVMPVASPPRGIRLTRSPTSPRMLPPGGRGGESVSPPHPNWHAISPHTTAPT